jgi:LruC domain-containing protein
MTNTTGSRGNVIASADVTMTSVADLQKFSIFVKKTNEVSFTIGSANEKGKAPQALIIPGEWQWPTERTNVKTAYPDFVKWVESVTNTDWYEYPVAGKVL